jgi:hypothetical protein
LDEESTVARNLSFGEYASELKKTGRKIIGGEQETLWIRSETMAMIRFPVFELTPPSSEELRRVLWRGPAAVATYLLQPDQSHPATACLYICRDKSYALEKLASAMRRNVRRGLKELEIVPLTAEQILAHGYQPYCDWLRRVGLQPESKEKFRKDFIARANCRAHVFVGAWKGRDLASFLSITELDEWAEIDGCFSADAMLHLRPNDALFFSVLSRFMKDGRCHTVSYGVSSLQALSNKDGLHAFKTKVGFEAVPVHRAFALHPFARPFANPLILKSINVALRLKPGDRRLKKAEGALAYILDEDRPLKVGTSE